MIDVALLDDFIRRFFGYGSWEAKLWFVGMEEGGGSSMEEIGRRLAAWDRSDDLADLKEFHSAIGESRWFDVRPKIQSTWGKLIRVALAAEGSPTDAESVRNYQRERLGRRSEDVALIELLPLPSPSTSHWLYGTLGIPTIATRERYREEVRPRRIQRLRRRIDKHRPAVVVFYGIAYRSSWEEIAQARFAAQPDARFATASNRYTRFVLAPHPVATGVRNSDFEVIGRWIAGRV